MWGGIFIGDQLSCWFTSTFSNVRHTLLSCLIVTCVGEKWRPHTHSLHMHQILHKICVNSVISVYFCVFFYHVKNTADYGVSTLFRGSILLWMHLSRSRMLNMANTTLKAEQLLVMEGIYRGNECLSACRWDTARAFAFKLWHLPRFPCRGGKL